MTAVPLALLRAAAPVDREVAREAAAQELSKGIYHADDPSLLDRVADRILRWLDGFGHLLNAGPGGAPAGGIGLVLVLAAVVALILWRTGPLRRSRVRPDVRIELSGRLDADEHRRRADGFAGQHRYAEAVRERMRAIVRELETRAVLDPRPGRTADEVAREAGALVPVIAAELGRGARIFDEVWYGGRAASAGTDAAMREVDQRVRTARLVLSRPAAAGPAGYVVPR